MSEINSSSHGHQEDLPAIAASEPAASADGKSPGTRLREARKALGMSVVDVAQAIRLSQRQITQLEEDAWDQLPGETFVRGFVRNYARLLKLDPEPLLATVHPPEPQAIELPESSKEELPVEGSTGGQIVPMIAGAGLLLVAAILVYVFWPQTPPRTSVVSQSAAPLASPAATDVPGAAAGGPAPTDAPLQPSAGDAASAPSAPAAVPVPAVVEPVKEPAPGPAAPAKAPAVESPRPAATAPEKVSAPTEVRSAESAKPFVVVDGPQRALRISVRELSWVEVRDAGGNTLIAYNFEAGTVRNLRGVAPLEIIIGNASGVDLSVDGKPIDVAAQARANVAKLTVE